MLDPNNINTMIANSHSPRTVEEKKIKDHKKTIRQSLIAIKRRDPVNLYCNISSNLGPTRPMTQLAAENKKNDKSLLWNAKPLSNILEAFFI